MNMGVTRDISTVSGDDRLAKIPDHLKKESITEAELSHQFREAFTASRHDQTSLLSSCTAKMFTRPPSPYSEILTQIWTRVSDLAAAKWQVSDCFLQS